MLERIAGAFAKQRLHGLDAAISRRLVGFLSRPSRQTEAQITLSQLVLGRLEKIRTGLQ